MRTREVHEAISGAEGGSLHRLADACLADAEVELVSLPEPVLVMARARETVDGELFNLGEILVTRCEVLLDGERGWAMVMGDDPERALCAAVLDAASRGSRHSEKGGQLERELDTLLDSAREGRRERWARVQPTRVEFEEMV